MVNSEPTSSDAAVTIAVTRHKEPNWLLWETLDSLAQQTRISAEVILLDQMSDPETERRLNDLSGKSVRFRYSEIPDKSLSYARNCAVKSARSDFVLFIDCDAIADEHWASEMRRALNEDGVAVVGGRIVPKWHSEPPLIAKARVVREQFSLFDKGEADADVRKVVGAGFGINRRLLGTEAYFDEKLGRRDGNLLGGEETDLCERALKIGLRVRYNGKAVVIHQVLPERTTYRWILKRLYYAGVSRALRGGKPDPTHGLGAWDYVALPIVLPIYCLGYLRGLQVSRRRQRGEM